ncbi:MAG: GTP-binding protein [Pirellulales bacterium]
MPPIRFIMIGGFLGAGKTTTIARLAAAHQAAGRRVGIVTNDQATDLVDTHSLRSQGYQVGEVAGACFCCNFNELTSTVAELSADERPDVILAEPVGSCTDLVATVVLPLMKLSGDHLDVAPYGVILKPSHGLKILRNESGGGFSPKAEYIFRKQLEEADFILLNQIDRLAAEEVAELTALLNRDFPATAVLHVSAKTGQGFDALLEVLDQRGQFGRRVLEIDYDVYAAGEAELGWLNSSLRVTSEAPFALDELLVDIVERLRTALSAEDAETAHLKAIGLWEGAYGVANLTSREAAAELSLASGCVTCRAEVVVNARVAIDPDRLHALVEAAVEQAARSRRLAVEFRQTQSFRPGRPVPTHRLSASD